MRHDIPRMTPITRRIAERVATTDCASIPGNVIDYSKALALSAFGAMVSGPSSTGSDIVTDYLRRAGGASEATVLAGFKAPAEAAAFANATYAHATEYEDDSFPEAVSSYTIFPAIMALGEREHSNGPTLLEAFVLGYETQARIGLACREARRLGYMVLTLAGSIGCAAGCARILGLDEEQTTNALSIAASQAGGIGYQTGSMAHIVEMGLAARNGVTAALLARGGLTGQPDVLEAPRGLFNIITAGKVDNPDGIISDWGSPYRVLEVGIKQFPCCYHLQRMIETAVELREAGRITPEAIEDIRVEVNAFFPTVVQHEEPGNEIEAQFSLPHALAAALLEPRVRPSSFAQEKIDSEPFREMRSKVRTVVREDWGWSPTDWTPRINFRLKDGGELVVDPGPAKGHPPHLLTFEACVEKYHGCVDGVLPDESIAASIDLLRDLEECGDIAKLFQIVSPLS